ncbi:MAG: hypothetical protein PWR29_151 [Methanolobus sp.]|jgi:hypothetical protein|nr:hypothetical protein [Methanolobus sp.]MDK2835008.1 hypothetical protein [Methanolobus sp.]MDK2911194.1 hypothetical protein [Methanolobus sp.]MDN5310152.1 hypothetical protein [Methanolobus sp.]
MRYGHSPNTIFHISRDKLLYYTRCSFTRAKPGFNAVSNRIWLLSIFIYLIYQITYIECFVRRCEFY